ncbi:MAG: efflux RND transporter periplasmic adaptor subunit [Nitrospirae bacterium]|nr:efflux RND transporter periplasmic adaptor subunit [Nitrospirota bacterium]MBF0533991.1 efflux RND transporter periplasmic adaptor subunit [Nitrospirota bacterium]MBF0616150.1 efflux RND transporter periplasmic adaptor subunit [Nitrospirota bacterium]
MKKLIIASVALALLTVVLYFFFIAKKNDKPNYRTEKIEMGEIVSAITATGVVNPVTTISVGTQVSGTIKEILVDYNSLVKKGQLIARIDPDTFQAQVNQAQANLKLAHANLKKSKASLNDAQKGMKRNKELFDKKFISQSDMDTSETNYLTASATVDASVAQVEQAQAALVQSESNLKYTYIYSPVDGIVISKSVDVGQTVAASFQTPTLFSIAGDLTKMQIDTNVVEADIGKAAKGQPVEFTVDAYPEITFKGVVTQVRNAAVTVSNVVTYDVVVKVDNSELKLKPGMTANATIIVSKKSDILKVPNSALRFQPLLLSKKTDSKGASVWILKGETPQRIAVTKGESDGNFTEVISSQITPGMPVIVESKTSSNTLKPPAGRPQPHGAKLF